MAILRKKWVVSIATKVVVALFATIIFGVFALIPRLGYTAEASMYVPIRTFPDYNFAIVDFKCNATFNPLLYPVSFVFGRGYFSGNQSMIYPAQADPSTVLGSVWGKKKVIEGEAAMKVVMDEFYYNLPFLPALFFAMELIDRRRLYLWFLSGVIGFAVAASIGAFFGLSLAVVSWYFVLPRLRKNFLSKEQSFEHSE